MKRKLIAPLLICLLIAALFCGCSEKPAVLSPEEEARREAQRERKYYPLSITFAEHLDRYEIDLLIRPVKGESAKETIQALLTDEFMEEMRALVRSDPHPESLFARYGDRKIMIRLCFPNDEIEYGWGGLGVSYSPDELSAVSRANRAWWIVPAEAEGVGDCTLEWN